MEQFKNNSLTNQKHAFVMKVAKIALINIKHQSWNVIYVKIRAKFPLDKYVLTNVLILLIIIQKKINANYNVIKKHT
jgi:hypothetical protein